MANTVVDVVLVALSIGFSSFLKKFKDFLGSEQLS